MPAITVQSLELTQAQKESLAETIISKFSELTRVPKDRIYVFFDGYTLDNAATDGILFSRRPPQAILGKFNESEHARLAGPREK
jgi:4-oxalocrotonate tautomerase